jgi:hypothetical protein
MAKTELVRMLLLVLCCGVAVSTQQVRAQAAIDQKGGHEPEYWKNVVKNHYAIPSGERAFPLARELSGYLGSTDPQLRDTLAYSILYAWIVEQKKLSSEELVTLLPEWQANLRAGIGETGTDSVFSRSFSVICLAALAERDLKDPFLGQDRFRALLGNALGYLHDERDLRGFDAKKGWIHATAHTADLLAALAESRFFTRADQGRVLAAIARRLATANEIFTHGEQDRLASVAVTIVSRSDFDSELWRAWVAEMDNGDQAVFEESPPRVQDEQRFENDSYFLCAAIARISLKPATPASADAQKTLLTVLRQR